MTCLPTEGPSSSHRSKTYHLRHAGSFTNSFCHRQLRRPFLPTPLKENGVQCHTTSFTQTDGEPLTLATCLASDLVEWHSYIRHVIVAHVRVIVLVTDPPSVTMLSKILALLRRCGAYLRLVLDLPSDPVCARASLYKRDSLNADNAILHGQPEEHARLLDQAHLWDGKRDEYSGWGR